MASATAFLQSRIVPFIASPVADIGDKTLAAHLLTCANNLEFLRGGTMHIAKYADKNKLYKKELGINLNITAKQINQIIGRFAALFLKCEDFICAMKNYPGGFAVSVPIMHDYILKNPVACTGYKYPSYYANEYNRIPASCIYALKNIIISLYNATNQTDYFFSFQCKNITNEAILWIWQILGRLRYAPWNELIDYALTFPRAAFYIQYAHDGTAFDLDDYLPTVEKLIEYMKNKYSDIIIDQFGDLNPPAFADMRTFALAGQTNISTGSNKKLQVNNNQIIKICQGENVILDLTN